jgi:predicted ATPase
VVCQCFAAHDLWYLGYPDRALVSIQDSLTLAQQFAHPFMLVHVLDFAAWLHQYRREGQLTREQSEADIALAAEHKIAFFLAHGTIFRGWALVEQGQRTEGIAQIRQGLAAYRATGAEAERHICLRCWPKAYGKWSSQRKDCLCWPRRWPKSTKDGVTARRSCIGSRGSCCWGSRRKITLRQMRVSTRPSTLPRRQQARSLELRAAVSLGRLWQRHGKRDAAHELLAAIYGWFSEGFETADLREAKVLLEALT